MIRWTFHLGIAFSMFSAHVSQADMKTSLAALETGSSMGVVAALAGKPSFKIERETKREEEWIYRSQGRLFFREGGLQKVILDDSLEDSTFVDPLTYDTSEIKKVSQSKKGKTVVAGDETKAFLREVAQIAEDTDSGSDGNKGGLTPRRTFPGMPPRR